MNLAAWFDRWWERPEVDRLANAVQEARLEFERLQAEAAQPGQPFRTDALGQANGRRLRTAHNSLTQAAEHLDNGKLQRGWDALRLAQRELLRCDLPKARRAAAALRHEADKIGGWRSRTIADALKNAKAPPAGTGSEVDWIIEAIEWRDDYYRTNYFRIVLRRCHLLRISLVLLTALAVLLALCWAGVFRNMLDRPELVTAVVIFGVLGASISVSQGLLWADVTSKIPTQQVRAFVVWMRPAIGAAAALAAVVLLRTALQEEPSAALLLATALTAGFSERYIVGAVDRFAQSHDKEGDRKS